MLIYELGNKTIEGDSFSRLLVLPSPRGSTRSITPAPRRPLTGMITMRTTFSLAYQSGWRSTSRLRACEPVDRISLVESAITDSENELRKDGLIRINETNRKGLALLILGVIFSFGTTMNNVYSWYMGIILGIIGTFMMFLDAKGGNNE